MGKENPLSPNWAMEMDREQKLPKYSQQENIPRKISNIPSSQQHLQAGGEAQQEQGPCGSSSSGNDGWSSSGEGERDLLSAWKGLDHFIPALLTPGKSTGTLPT